jgi:uncharacterized protein (DUF736 family)
MKLKGNFFQAREKKSENSPDMRGTLTDEDGNEYEIAGWSKSGEKAGKYLSVQIKPKGEYQTAQQPAPAPEPEQELPF